MDFNSIKLKNHINMIDYYKNVINDNNYIEILNRVYSYVKDIAPFYFENQDLLKNYKYLRDQIIILENTIEKQTIVNYSIPFKINEKKEFLLEQIVQQARQHLIEQFFSKEKITDTLNINFGNYCEEASAYIDYLCQKYDIDGGLLFIAPGFNKEAEIYYGAGSHYANFINYNNRFYLIDITYQQYFSARTNNLNRIGIPYLSGCDVGTFMLMTEEGQKIAKELITKGYVELTDEMMKTYLDAFAISYRNGLYYESTKDYSFKTSYTIDDYQKFLSGEDNQINHEGLENLGYQKKPLKHKLTLK